MNGQSGAPVIVPQKLNTRQGNASLPVAWEQGGQGNALVSLFKVLYWKNFIIFNWPLPGLGFGLWPACSV